MLKQNPNLINSILGLVSKALFTELLSARGFQFFNLPQLECVFCVIPWHICFPDSHLTFLSIKNRKRRCGWPQNRLFIANHVVAAQICNSSAIKFLCFGRNFPSVTLPESIRTAQSKRQNTEKLVSLSKGKRT